MTPRLLAIHGLPLRGSPRVASYVDVQSAMGAVGGAVVTMNLVKVAVCALRKETPEFWIDNGRGVGYSMVRL
jgi:DNA-binding response OmpR family regulator